MNEIDVALICRALGDSNRLKIIELLTQEERCACVLLEHFEITQPTLSHHMKILKNSDLIHTRKEGKWTYYSMNCRTMTAFRDYIAKLRCDQNQKGECC